MRSVTHLKSYCAECRSEIQRAGGERLRGGHQELIVKTWENNKPDVKSIIIIYELGFVTYRMAGNLNNDSYNDKDADGCHINDDDDDDHEEDGSTRFTKEQ